MMRISDYSEAGLPLKNIQAFVADAESEQVLKDCFARLQMQETVIVRGDVSTAIDRFRSQSSPSLLIVDISGSDMPLSDMEDLANVCSPDVRVIAIGGEDSVGLCRSLLGCGVSDYLIKPVPPTLLQSTLEALRSGERRKASTTGKIVTLFGVKGGVGGTSILCSLADILSREEGRKVMLIDPDIMLGDIFLHFGLSAGQGFSSLLKSPERLDTLVLERIAQPVSSRLDLLCSQEEFGVRQKEHPESLLTIIEELRSRYHFIFIDMPQQITDETLSILGHSDICLPVLDPSLASLKNAKALLERLEKTKDGPKTLSILNNTRSVSKAGLDSSRIDAFLGCAPDYTLPYDGRRFAAAALKGEPVSRSGGKAAAALRKIASDLVGRSEKEKAPLWRSSLRLLGR